MDLRGRESIRSDITRSNPLKIGIFSRLSTQRPIDALFHCFQFLTKDIGATLHCYGMGSPSRLKKLSESLDIHHKVFFEGHQTSIEKTLKEDNLTIIWMISYNSFLGYASIEVGSFGIPIVFWDLGAGNYKNVLKKTRGAVHTFSTIPEFIEFNSNLLASPEKLKSLGEKLRKYILSEHEINNHIVRLEEYYIDIVNHHYLS
jgi:glycosyltransferase involved in cell wall biosynthesis